MNVHEARTKSLNKRFMICLSLVVSIFLASSVTSSAWSQEGMQAANTQTISMDVVPEPGCPVEVTGARTELGFDSFGLPVFGKTYIDYKNGGDKAISAVKFRVRYLDQNGVSRGTFHANDEAFVPQGAMASGKFAHYKLRKNIHQGKIRVLAVKFSDGTAWESVRMKEIMKAQEEGKELEHDDDGPAIAPTASGTKSEVVTPTPEVQPAQAVKQEPAPTPTPTVETPPAQPVQPVQSTQPVEPLTAKPVEAPPVAPSASPPETKPAKEMVEEEPLSATPQALPLKKNADAFGEQ